LRSGDAVSATIPLVDGGSVTTAALRGKVVVLELGPTLSADAESAYARLWKRHADRLVVIRVLMAAEPHALAARFERGSAPYLASWDPQGAVAVRIGAAVLPAFYVLDAGGRVALVVESAGEGGAALERAVDSVLAGAAPPKSTSD
jgi:hypothetical protein